MQITVLSLGFALIVPSVWAQEVTIYSTDFTNLAGWTVTTGCEPGFAWAADATPATHFAGPFVSPPASLNFNNGIDIGSNDQRTCGSVESDPIDLSVAVGVPELRFMASWDMENDCEWDVLSLRVLHAASSAVLLEVPCFSSQFYASPWTTFQFPLDRSWGEVRIEFAFDTGDVWVNQFSGPFIDDLSVVDIVPIYSPFCFGDGSATPCPCGNTGAAGAGCVNSTGAGATLFATGSASVGNGDLVLRGTHLRSNQFGTYLQGTNGLNGGNGLVFGAGLRCVGGSLIRLQQVQSDNGGHSNTSIDVALEGNVSPGDTRFYQLWYRDPVNSPCSSNFNLTNGIAISWVP